MSKIGYIRVSTEHQETARQQEIMCDYQVDRIFSEKLSGANKDRPQLRAVHRTNKLVPTKKFSPPTALGSSSIGMAAKNITGASLCAE